VTDADFERAAGGGANSGTQAAQNKVQQPFVGNRNNSQESKKALENKGFLPTLPVPYNTA
jgi:hypothetical protein